MGSEEQKDRSDDFSYEVFPAELVDELALVRDALHFAISWLGWRKWIRANGSLEWCSRGILVPSGCGAFAPFWKYESDWLTYLSRLRLERSRNILGTSPYNVLSNDDVSLEDDAYVARLVSRRRMLERVEREWCRINSYSLRRVRPSILTFRSAVDNKVVDSRPLLYSEYARISLNETRWYIKQSDLIDFVGRLVRTLCNRFGRYGSETTFFDFDPVVAAYLDRVSSVQLWRHKLDETLNSFDDETLELLVGALASCRTHFTNMVQIYSNTREPVCNPSGTRLETSAENALKALQVGTGSAISFLIVDIRFTRVSRLEVWNDSLCLFLGRVQQNLTTLMQTSGDWLTMIPVPDVEHRDAIFIVRIAEDFDLRASLSRILLSRSDLRSLLNYTFLPSERVILYGGSLATETAALSAIFSAKETSHVLKRAISEERGKSIEKSAKVKQDDQVCCDIREVLLRALQLDTVALYLLRYSLDVSHRTTESDSDPALAAFLRRSKLGKERFFIDSGIERGNALTDAVLSFAAQVGVDRDVNSVRLSSVQTFSKYENLARTAKKVTTDQQSFECLLVATSALLSTKGVEHYTRSANQQLRDGWPRSTKHGIFFRHEKYKDLQLLLLPAETSPVFDRVIELPDLSTEFQSDNCFGYLRLCLLLLRGYGSFSERALTQPSVIVSLLREVISHITMSDSVHNSSYSPLLMTHSSDSQQTEAPSVDKVRPTLQNLFERDRIAAMVRIDPFLSITSCQAAQDESASQKIASLLSNVPRLYFPNCKLWRALDSLSMKCAFVRTSALTFCPRLLLQSGISLAQRGVVPLESTSANDTWKLYLMDNVRSKVLMPCDRVYTGPALPNDLAALSYNDLSGETIVPLNIPPTSADAAETPNVSVEAPSENREFSERRENEKKLVRVVDGQISITNNIPFFAVKDANGRNWLLYNVANLSTFDSLVSSMKLSRALREAQIVRLINWEEHFPLEDTTRPKLEKVSAKRVYLINGVIGFCEQPTKFVASEKLPRMKGLVTMRNFSNALIRPGDSLCFHNTVDRVDPTIRLSPMHFYHRVYQSLVRSERHPIVGDGGYVDLRFRETADYFVLVFQCTRIWFPRAEMLRRIQHEETTCYGETPRHLVSLVDFYVRQALRK